jgi:pyruvate/2-oxoglutarate dehydrogenase complex dihydrolipoamide dehydrogenase (E3) component
MKEYDLVIIGAGSGGLVAAGFAARLGARVALVEKNRIGGDCTWTGCVPSKALLKAAKVAHELRTAAHYGISANEPVVDMARVRDYVRAAIQQVYQFESPEELERQGVDVLMGEAGFFDSTSIAVNGRTISSRTFLLTTGARPVIPPITGLHDVPFLTYEQIFDNDRLPRQMLVVGGGPIGMEMAQAYQRLGSRVTVIAERLLPKEEPEAREAVRRVFEREGMQFLWARAKSARKDGSEIVIITERGEARGDLLLIASGRKPAVETLDLDKAGVKYSRDGIPVDDRLRTNVQNIYAAGDVVGKHQFTHFAGWQAFQAVRNALLPGGTSGFADVVPWTTFTDPEVAHLGQTEAQARELFGSDRFGNDVQVHRWEMRRTDRAVCENDTDGFIKVIAQKDGTILGATIVAGRAGEAIGELVLAMKQKTKLAELASAIHVYPTYSTAVQQLSADAAMERALSGMRGRVLRGLSKLIR